MPKNRYIVEENEMLKKYIIELEQWKGEGDAIFEKPEKLGFLFFIGCWWGRKPRLVKCPECKTSFSNFTN